MGIRRLWGAMIVGSVVVCLLMARHWTVGHSQPGHSRAINRVENGQRATAPAGAAASGRPGIASPSTQTVASQASSAFQGLAVASAAGIRDLKTIPDLHLNRDPDMGTPRFVRRRSAFLSDPLPRANPERIAAAFIKANGRTFTLAPSDIRPPNARITRDLVTKHNGMRSLTWQQEHEGLDIHGATFMLHLTEDNRIINVSSRALHIPCVRFHDTVSVTEEEALKIAREELATDGADAGPSAFSIHKSAFVYYPLDQISVVKAWDLIVEASQFAPRTPPRASHRLIIRADTGEIVEDINLTWSLEPATFSVYTNDSPTPMTPGPTAPTNFVPVVVSRTNLTITALNTNASPEGWIPVGENRLVGNNADIYADWDDNDSPDGPPVTGTTYRVFDYSLDLAQFPTGYVAASQVQAFYLVNHFHDRTYALGFDESAGNFQADNYGRGGFSGDKLKVEVQKAADLGYPGVNQAWYQGWGDGSQCRIGISIWARANPHRCGVLDAQLMYHEATHGLSTRLIGDGFGLTSVPARGLGEGWSDFFGLTLLAEPVDDPEGCYPFADYAAVYDDWDGTYYYGVRRFPYSTDMTKAPQTIADIDPNQMAFPPEVPMNPAYGLPDSDADQMHNIGEIWCLMLWECRANLIEQYGFPGNELMMQLVVDGMKLSPVNPTFIEARDAILQADLVGNAGTNQTALWRGFARRGLGYSAWVPGSVSTVGIVEGYDLPFGVTPVLRETAGDGDGYVEPGESGELVVMLASHEMGLSNITAVLSTQSSNITVTASNAALPSIEIGGTATSAPPFEISVGGAFPGNADATFIVSVQSVQGTFDQPLLLRIGNPGDYAPEISDIAVTDLGETNAWVAWESGIPADGQVEYGISTNYDLRTVLDPAPRTNHLHELTGLDKGTVYHYRVVSTGTNGLTAYSSDRTLRTRARVYVYAASIATQELGTIDFPFRSLQAAADAAKAYGDDILVAMGTYTSDQVEAVLVLDGSDWDLSIEGGYSPDFLERDIEGYETVIDGQRERRGIRLNNGAKLSVAGVTITRGEYEWGGGVSVRMSEFSADGCMVTDNSSANALNTYGGGLYATLASDVRLDNTCLLKNSSGRGGGIFAVSADTSVQLSAVQVIENDVFYTGGGIYVQGGATAEITGSVLLGNTAAFRGGGVDVSPFSSAAVQDSTISDNVVLSVVDPDSYGGGGVSVAGSASMAELTILGTVLWGNTSPGFGGDLRCATFAEVHATHCNIGDIYGTLTTSNSVISADPLFASPEAGDFHLLYGSPCIDAGMTNYGGGTVDMDGEARPFGAAVDIGADEFTDKDGDHMADYWETREFPDLEASDGTGDADGDDLADFGEYINQSDPHDVDTDDDAMQDGWEAEHALNVRSNDASLNPDGDAHDNLCEYAADTDPHDSNSVLRLLSVEEVWDGTRLDWQGGVDSRQWLEWNTDLLDTSNWVGITGFPPPTPETNAVVIFGITNRPAFYRIRAER